MSRDHYDVVVAGLGAMGSAVAYQAAKAGAHVLGLDQHRPPHRWGSTHGDTRITRLATGEGFEYVPLAMRSHQIWADIEEQTGTELLVQCAGLVLGHDDGPGFVSRTVDAARRFGIHHTHLTTDELRADFPQFTVADGESGYFEPTAGLIRPEAAVRAQLEVAHRHGAELRTGERVVSYHDDGRGVSVRTDHGTYRADTLVAAVGPWINQFFDTTESVFEVHRQVLYWFDVDPAHYERYRQAPIFIWGDEHSPRTHFYGFPAVDGPSGGVKLATEHYDAPTTPDTIARQVTDREIREFYETCVRERLIGVTDRCRRAVTCMYTLTPDDRFVIDRHPRDRNVLVVSPCSGHGFKHSAAIGEGVAQLALDGVSILDLRAFTFDRFLAADRSSPLGPADAPSGGG